MRPNDSRARHEQAAYAAFLLSVAEQNASILSEEMEAARAELAALEAELRPLEGRVARLRDHRVALTRRLGALMDKGWTPSTSSQYWGPIERRKQVRRNGRQRREDRARQSVGAFTSADFDGLLRSYGSACARCGDTAHDGEPIVPDHVIPLAKGGTDTLGNIQPLCRRCNAFKGDAVIDYRDEAFQRLYGGPRAEIIEQWRAEYTGRRRD